jgi:ankyrin repeat protein
MAVHLASYGGHLAVLEILLKYGAKVNMIDTAGYTPLHYAVQEAFLLMFSSVIVTAVSGARG